ncbi:MAG: GNAT family N-acetyltransferase [Chloroherpetonaceae bacterium]|nr:GNAT family N-acetyltransferase [Chthonomonadaceae bacterium]MDW8209102.1 GNAT family N-acetyltransferase [Chloroherpetonaceae bacterium]
MRVVAIRDSTGITALEGVWRALQARCPDLTPFQTWEWNEVWWKHFGARKRLLLLIFHAGEQPVGIAPLYISRHLGTPLRRLAWVGTGQSDYLGPVVLPGYAMEVAEALWQTLRAYQTCWDIADLQQIRADSALLSPSLLSTEATPLPMEPCPFLTLPDDWSAFTARLSKKMRANLGYYERLLYRTFPDARMFLADASTLEEGMRAFFALHQSRWNARWLPGVLGSRRVQAFHCEVAGRFLANGWLRLHLLQADGNLRAALYCYALGKRTYYYLGGFAPEYARYSPGTLLTARAIRNAITEGHIEFDFLRGDEAYKYRWHPEQRLNYRLLLPGAYRGLGALTGRAGLALNRIERYVERRLKALTAQQGHVAKER